MEHKTEANMEYASIPLKEKENEVCNLEQGTLNKEELQNGIH